MRAWDILVSYQDNGPCRNCGLQRAELPGGRCPTCAGYLKRTGTERSAKIILRHMKRLLDGDKSISRASSHRVKERFMEKVDLLSERPCWSWIGYPTNRTQYGLFRMDGVQVGAHRAAYMLYVGAIPPDLVIDHLCRNKRCVNPDHLELVTQSENTRRKVASR